MTKDCGLQLKMVRVDGGMTKSNLMLQMQSDILGVNVVRPKNVETTSWGAALAAGVAPGVAVWSLADIKSGAVSASFHPEISKEGGSSLGAALLQLRFDCLPANARLQANSWLRSSGSTVWPLEACHFKGTGLDCRDTALRPCRTPSPPRCRVYSLCVLAFASLCDGILLEDYK